MRGGKALHLRVFCIRELTFDRAWVSNIRPLSKVKCILEGLKHRALFQRENVEGLTCVNMSYICKGLTYVDFTYVDFTYVDFTSVDFTYVDFTYM